MPRLALLRFSSKKGMGNSELVIGAITDHPFPIPL